jgi:hypothetical protein
MSTQPTGIFDSSVFDAPLFDDGGVGGCQTVNYPFNLVTLRNMVRRELLDTGIYVTTTSTTTGRWWTDTELNNYIQDWQDELQERFEFVWGTATVTLGSGTSTIALAAIDPNMMRLDAVYWSSPTQPYSRRLVGRSIEELDILRHQWRSVFDMYEPRIVYQDDSTRCSLYPPPINTGTAVFEYPKVLNLIADTDLMAVPAWTKYSVNNYCTYRAYLRAGPNQDIAKAMKRKQKFLAQCIRYHALKANIFSDRAPHLKPVNLGGFGNNYEGNILNPKTPLIP